jgi:hypothetical protein
VYVGLRGGRRRSCGASSSKITATCRRLTALKSSENLTIMGKQCRALFCPSARKSLPADRPRQGLKHPLIRSNIAGAVGIASLSWPCMYLGFLAMYRGMKSIKPYNSKLLFPAHLLKCTCWCQSRGKRLELLGALTPRHDGLGWRSLCRRASAGPGSVQHDTQPQEAQDCQLVEKQVWNHDTTPSLGGETGGLYLIRGPIELSAAWRYTTRTVKADEDRSPVSKLVRSSAVSGRTYKGVCMSRSIPHAQKPLLELH